MAPGLRTEFELTSRKISILARKLLGLLLVLYKCLLTSTGSLIICLFGVLRRFQHCTGHIMMGSWKGRGNQYIQFIRVLYCKLPTNGKQLPAFPLEAVPGIEPRPQRWEARVLPLCHRGSLTESLRVLCYIYVIRLYTYISMHTYLGLISYISE